MQPVFLLRHQVDDAAWNACILAADNGTVYTTTPYLDATATEWNALVLPGYSAVMPLPCRKKWGVYYIYQPFACGQLGLVGNEISAHLLHLFLNAIPAHFRYWEFPLNFNNRFAVAPYALFERHNYVLPLHIAYAQLHAAYRTNLKRILKKAFSKGHAVVRGIPTSAVIALASAHEAANGNAHEYRRFETLIDAWRVERKAETYGVYNIAGTLLASAVFVLFKNRAYYILPGNVPPERLQGASHYLLDAFIKNHAETPLLLDFEGSDVPGLQYFYSSFGAIDVPYTAIRLNRLPAIIRWLKPS